MTTDIENTIKSLLGDIEAMRCECPSHDLREDGGEEMQTHWFGGFGEGYYDDEGFDFYVQWPNLGILADKLQKMLITAKMEGK